MKIKITFLFLLLTLLSISAYSQAKIEFQKSDHDFGNVSEGTLASHDFVFTNTGNEPLLISSVKASCGCTTPYWTKDPVLPGKQGKITASYDSKGRPGAFNKSVSVSSNAEVGNSTLFIKGVVINKENIEKVYSDKEIAASPKIDVEKPVVQLGKVEKGQNIPFEIVVNNGGNSNLEISQLRAPCNCVRLEAGSIKSISPGKSETIKAIYSPLVTGSKNELVSIHSNDITKPEIKFTLNSEVVENLSNKSILKENQATITF
ncbi:hypothetical protein BH23BAC1_BH23BAC1_35310 [soil metagenome]